MSAFTLAATLATVLVGADYLGAPVIQEAVPLAEPGRYESPRTYDETLQWYKWVFKNRGGGRWRNVVNLPHIRAKHIESLRKRSEWQGINIYEHDGHVRIFIVPRGRASIPKR